MTTDVEVPLAFLPPTLDVVQHRAADVERIDVDNGTILMRAVPYDVEIELADDLFESFAPAAFARAASAPGRCKLWHEHGGPLIGHATTIEDRPDGAWIEAKISNTLAGQEARELANDGTLDQVSITFRPLRDWLKVTRSDRGFHVRHSRAALLGVALVAHGAYAESAFIASVREAGADRRRERALARLRALQA
jgi:HK97 family phage prohead protease